MESMSCSPWFFCFQILQDCKEQLNVGVETILAVMGALQHVSKLVTSLAKIAVLTAVYLVRVAGFLVLNSFAPAHLSRVQASHS